MNKPLIVIGAGGHAKVVISILLRLQCMPIGILDSDRSKWGSQVFGVPVLGDDSLLDRYASNSVSLVNGIGSVGKTGARKRIQTDLQNHGYIFATVIDPTAIVSPDCEFQSGAQVMAGAVIQPGCHIGMGTIINTHATVDHDCRIGNFAHIAPGATLSGDITVGDGAHIGTGASLIQGVRVGDEALIAAGAAVIGDIAAGHRVGGVPARVI